MADTKISPSRSRNSNPVVGDVAGNAAKARARRARRRRRRRCVVLTELFIAGYRRKTWC